MPQQTYEVTAPDGRVLEITGDRAPTEAELKSIFNMASMKQPQAPAAPERGLLGDALEYGKGIVKSGLGVVEQGGNLIRDYVPGMKALENATGAYVDTNINTAPTNTPQTLGKLTGDVAQFFVPTSRIVGTTGKVAELAAKYGRTAEAVKAGGIAAMQGAGPVGAGVTAGLTAVMPGGGAVKRLSSALEEGAEKRMAQALGATTKPLKKTASELAPGMLERGVKGSRAAMLEQAEAQTAAVGQQLGDDIARLAQSGATASGDAIRQRIAQASQGLMTTNAAGEAVAIEGMQPVLKQLGKLDEFVASLGPDIPFDKAARLKTAWDRIVSKAGLYGPNAAAKATDNAKAWAFREGATGMRRAMEEGGDDAYAALNKEYKFWKGLRDVLSATQQRTQSQTGGLIAAGAGGVGGFLLTDSNDSLGERFAKVGLGVAASRKLVQLLQSPAYRTTISAPLKKKLADALATDSATGIYMAGRSILQAMPAAVSQSMEAQ